VSSRSKEDKDTLSKLLVLGLEHERQWLFEQATQNGEPDISEEEKKAHNRKVLSVKRIFESWGVMIPKSIKEFPVNGEAPLTRIERKERSRNQFRDKLTLGVER